ncbi:HypE family protein [Natronomonas pharaonis DSM 2160]|uniref:HypE family protein n=1 Tax=Natronomonas pharaonis (strain ATCC 35678 / DSM 2160 / CIP 103997 / JCM 8858 / NBRC 14720 / NCIMB 2260 / Gabara) TaxID=348780 RepID=A0A1U7EXF6_NATPD|nr:AIR synthase family protein [Natronomonas pharaonis]CAI49865.1 HypE family protein [Natronomonas pharaonis DSM 2160]
MPGKVHPDDLLSHVFGRTGEDDPAVVKGPADGEDAAAIDPPAGTLVVSSDPISLAASRVGTLGVHVACNDIAVSGADPRWLSVVLMLPSERALEPITRDIHAAASDLGATIVGGHSEYVDALERPIVSLTAMGMTEAFVPTGGAEPGDRVVLTGAAGIEGTAILAADFGGELDVPTDVVERGASFFEDVSVAADAQILREYATSMHDPTEGGVAAGLHEIARASDVRLDVEREAVPIREATRALCDAAGVDPLRIFGSGAVAGTVPESEVDDALAALSDADIPAAEVGVVSEGSPELRMDGESTVDPIEDDLYPLWAAADSEK